MFPVSKKFLVRYRTEGNAFATMIKTIIDKNAKQIITECQKYLDEYADGNRPAYSTDLDFLIERLNAADKIK